MKLPEELLKKTEGDPRWSRGPFELLKEENPKTKGSRFETITRFLLNGNETKTTENDMELDNLTYEIKGSCVTKRKDSDFSFLQIRPDDSYDYLLLVCFYFDGSIEMYRIDKFKVNKMIADNVFRPQHRGKKGKSGTYCYNGNINIFKEYEWKKFKIDNNRDISEIYLK